MGACTRRIAAVSVGIKASSLNADRFATAAWCMPSPHDP
jgi:thiamine biosynthesis lipoprotein ApbE